MANMVLFFFTFLVNYSVGGLFDASYITQWNCIVVMCNDATKLQYSLGLIKNYNTNYIFERKSFMVTKAAFIDQTYSKTSNILK